MAIRKHIPWLTALLILIHIPGSNYVLYAQPSPRETTGYFWFNVGLGLGSQGAAAGGLNLSIQPSRPGFLLFSLRGMINSQIVGDEFREVAFLVGYSSKRPQSHGYFSITTGISRVSGSAIDATFGVPVEVQLFYTPLSFAGIGLQGFANLNKEETFGGVLLCLQFGKLR